MIKFEILSYPEAPVDFALMGALEWIASEYAGKPIYAQDMVTLQTACHLAGIDVPALLDMVQRGHLAIGWHKPDN